MWARAFYRARKFRRGITRPDTTNYPDGCCAHPRGRRGCADYPPTARVFTTDAAHIRTDFRMCGLPVGVWPDSCSRGVHPWIRPHEKVCAPAAPRSRHPLFVKTPLSGKHARKTPAESSLSPTPPICSGVGFGGRTGGACGRTDMCVMRRAGRPPILRLRASGGLHVQPRSN